MTASSDARRPRKSGTSTSTRQAGAWRVHRADGGGPVGGAAVGEVVAIHRGDDDVLEPELGDGAADALRLLAVLPRRLAVGDRAVAAVPRAHVAQDHEGGGGVLPALADVRAVRLLAHGVQVEVAHEPAQADVVGAARRAHLEPARACGPRLRAVPRARGSGNTHGRHVRAPRRGLCIMPRRFHGRQRGAVRQGSTGERSIGRLTLVPKGGLEPPRVAPHAPQTCASASSATSARRVNAMAQYTLRGRDATTPRAARRGPPTAQRPEPPIRLAQPRIERIADALAEQVVGQHRDQDGEAGIEDSHQPISIASLPSFRMLPHVA